MISCALQNTFLGRPSTSIGGREKKTGKATRIPASKQPPPPRICPIFFHLHTSPEYSQFDLISSSHRCICIALKESAWGHRISVTFRRGRRLSFSSFSYMPLYFQNNTEGGVARGGYGEGIADKSQRDWALNREPHLTGHKLLGDVSLWLLDSSTLVPPKRLLASV